MLKLKIMHQKVMAVKNDDIAYTSPSTAENQKESEKVYVRDPITPAAKIAIILKGSSSLSDLLLYIFLPKAVIVQKRNKIENDEHKAESTLTAAAICSVAPVKVSETKANILAIILHKGAPGGCPTCNLADVEIYSAASQ